MLLNHPCVGRKKKNTHTVTKTHFVRLANTIQQQVSGQLEHVIGYNQVTHSQWRGRDNPPHPPSLLSRCNSDVAGGSFFFFFFERMRVMTHTDRWVDQRARNSHLMKPNPKPLIRRESSPRAPNTVWHLLAQRTQKIESHHEPFNTSLFEPGDISLGHHNTLT